MRFVGSIVHVLIHVNLCGLAVIILDCETEGLEFEILLKYYWYSSKNNNRNFKVLVLFQCTVCFDNHLRVADTQ